MARFENSTDLLKQNNCRQAFTLVEVVVAIFVVVVGIVGVFGLLTQTYAFTSSSSFNLTAAYLAKEGVELVSNIRDSNILEGYYGDLENWSDKIDVCSFGCEMDYSYSGGPTPYGEGRNLLWNGQFWNYNSGTPSFFKRKITTVLGGTDNKELTIEVDIFWSERGRSHVFKTQEKIYNWF